MAVSPEAARTARPTSVSIEDTNTAVMLTGTISPTPRSPNSTAKSEPKISV